VNSAEPQMLSAVPLVSVLMPAHNAAAFVEASVRSVLSQTLTDLELIVVDDGSTDDTPKVLAEIDDPRLVVLRLDPNQGVVVARNAAIERARGRYIALLDADDLAEPERLQRQIDLLSRGDAQVCGTDHIVWHMASGRRKRGKQHHRDEDLRALLTVYSPLCNSSVTAVAQAFKDHRYDEQFRYAEDYELWIRMAESGLRFTACGPPLVAYRVHAHQMSVANEAKLQAAFERARERYVRSLGLDAAALPRRMPWRERLRLGPAFLAALNARIGTVSLRANYEIYARYQYRRNGLWTPFRRLERLLAALWGRWYGAWLRSRRR
jgi:glycosyltransferase involved in cell wall biosynthesis